MRAAFAEEEQKGLKKAEIGIIGGSGLYAMPGLTNVREESVTTPFGDPSEAFILGELRVAVLLFLRDTEEVIAYCRAS